MEEPARGMERTSTFAGMWRAEASRRGGCWESRAMDRRGQASAAVNCSRWRSGDRAENGCAMVPVGSGAREGPTHGVPGGGRSRAGLWGSVACGGGGCVLLPASYYEEVMRVKTAWGLRPESLGMGEWGAGGGLSPAGMAGVPWGPVGAEAPHVGWVRNHDLFFRHRSS